MALAAGRLTEADGELRAALDEARRGGLAGEALEARRGLAEIEIAAGKTASGRARLAALEKEAREKGFLLIARKASRTLASKE